MKRDIHNDFIADLGISIPRAGFADVEIENLGRGRTGDKFCRLRSVVQHGWLATVAADNLGRGAIVDIGVAGGTANLGACAPRDQVTVVETYIYQAGRG